VWENRTTSFLGRFPHFFGWKFRHNKRLVTAGPRLLRQAREPDSVLSQC